MFAITYPSLMIPNCHCTGEYKEELQDGTGTMKWPDGSEYKGSFRSGRKHGNGRMFWAHNKETYEGEWYSDLRHGLGVRTYSDGRVFR